MITLTQDQAARLGIAGLGHRRETKYHNQHVVVDGIRFDSKAEAERYGELRMLEQAGEITNLRAHPSFIIVDADEHGRAMHYVADSMYMDWRGELGEITVEDVKALDRKGRRPTCTPLWRLKWRLAQARFPHYTFRVEER